MPIKPLQDALITICPPTIGQPLLAQRERDGVRVLTSAIIALHPQADGRLLIETHHSLYPVRVRVGADTPRPATPAISS